MSWTIFCERQNKSINPYDCRKRQGQTLECSSCDNPRRWIEPCPKRRARRERQARRAEG